MEASFWQCYIDQYVLLNTLEDEKMQDSKISYSNIYELYSHLQKILEFF